MNNQKGFANIILIVLVVVLAGVVGYLTLIKKPTSSTVVEQPHSNTPPSSQQTNPPPTNNPPPQSPVTQVVWENLISSIRTTLGSTFLGVRVEESRSLSIFQKTDITGDGVAEALVNLGTGGAYTDYLTLLRVENGKPVIAQFKQQDGKISPLMFLAGASVRHGENVTMLQNKNAIYSGSWSTDDYGKVDSCSVTAYQWNAQTKTFDFSTTLSNEIKPDFCRKAGI